MSKSLRSRCTQRVAHENAYSLVNVSSSGAGTHQDVNLTKSTYRANICYGKKHRRIIRLFRPVLTCRCLQAATSRRGSRHMMPLCSSTCRVVHLTRETRRIRQERIIHRLGHICKHTRRCLWSHHDACQPWTFGGKHPPLPSKQGNSRTAECGPRQNAPACSWLK
jgi:hypothetical protein